MWLSVHLLALLSTREKPLVVPLSAWNSYPLDPFFVTVSYPQGCSRMQKCRLSRVAFVVAAEVFS
eukprot:jgi/Bigna1/64185/fgenesh1_kg.69_\